MSIPALQGIEAHKVISEDEAAKIAGLSLPHFRRLRYGAEGPAYVKLGERRVGYRQGDLVEWLSARVSSKPEAA